MSVNYKHTDKKTDLKRVRISGEDFFKMSNYDALRPFFMSIVSDSDHWMFISSNGGLTAGRKNAEFALFPYYTDDKITEMAEFTGSKTILQITKGNTAKRWEPFSCRQEGIYEITRNLYKGIYGNKIIFEEENHDLGLTFRYAWNSSDKYGFVRRSTLINNTDEELLVKVLDGIQNIMPHGVPSDLQNSASNLVDAYKRSELHAETGLGVYALSAIIVDRAEPSEALKANTVWSYGLDEPTHLLSSLQLDTFRKTGTVKPEADVKAEKGAYFLVKALGLPARSEKSWMLVANVNQNHSAVARLVHEIKNDPELPEKVSKDVEAGTRQLVGLVAAADGLQFTEDTRRDARHFSNVMFNIMRGGIFDNNYQIEKWDFSKYLEKANKALFQKHRSTIDSLPEAFSQKVLHELALTTEDPHFIRLSVEYLPLKFSRRHGDPSRPWNKFSINTRNESDGSKLLDYQGNWRDIFQNWEALAHSYPAFIEGMIFKFLNATTFDGYNPYRVTKDGFDWETIEPDNPWSYIGYWGDHQIIYLLKFLEFIEDYDPGKLQSYLDQELFVYANVPYKIKPYQDILKDPKDTIGFDHELDVSIRRERERTGADAALLKSSDGAIYTVSFLEKILATTLAKLSNFIPEGGIWMNTQRPEWNDANNALVGNGVSMVTLYYLRRFMSFFQKLLAAIETREVPVSEEMMEFFKDIMGTLEQHQHLLGGSFSNQDRKRVLDGLGQAGSNFRENIYRHSFKGKKAKLPIREFKKFVDLSLQYLEHSIRANKRADGLYHAYNLMTLGNENDISISHLDEMLEGQVAVLSSGYLTPSEVLSVLDAMKQSKLFRHDQYSYILYPNKQLPGFFEKNQIPESAVNRSELLQQLVRAGDVTIIEKDINGVYHFNGNFKNAYDLKSALEKLKATQYAKLVEKDYQLVLDIFEEVFNHKAFTGRSGTFFGYEGLGSIYWHMVSKLLLAVEECCLQAIEQNEKPDITGKLLEHFYEIMEGIGVHKSPALYGAFPTDPYSHTPAGRGAQQPGMTGQVKEDILSRFGELGIFVKNGCLQFDPCLLRKAEFLTKDKEVECYNVHGQAISLKLAKGELGFTCCQVPVIYQLAKNNKLTISFNDGTELSSDALTLDEQNSRKLFERTGEIVELRIQVRESNLR